MEGTKEELKKFLKKWLKVGTECQIQHDGWCCNTCFFNFADRIGIPESLQQGLWQNILAVRGDYDEWDWSKEEE